MSGEIRSSGSATAWEDTGKVDSGDESIVESNMLITTASELAEMVGPSGRGNSVREEESKSDGRFTGISSPPH